MIIDINVSIPFGELFVRWMLEFAVYIGPNREIVHRPIETKYRQISNIRHTFVGNQIVDHLDVVGASPVGAARTTFSFSI